MSKKNEKREDQQVIKVILLGESGVGKTNLIKIAAGKHFNDIEPTTSNSSFYEIKLQIHQKDYTLNLWDTIGQEKFRHFTKLFYNNSKIVIFVYDITSKESFDELNYWVNDIKNALGDDGIIKGVVGNKRDLFEQQKIKDTEAEAFADSINAKFLTISAKEDTPDVFINYLECLVGDYLLGGLNKYVRTFSLSKEANLSQRKKKNCC